LTDKELVVALQDAVKRERHSTAEVIERMAEFDEKKLWREEGYPHFFAAEIRPAPQKQDVIRAVRPPPVPPEVENAQASTANCP
jgi:hypothetical protein